MAVKAAAVNESLFHTPLHPVKKMTAGDPMPRMKTMLANQQPFG